MKYAVMMLWEGSQEKEMVLGVSEVKRIFAGGLITGLAEDSQTFTNLGNFLTQDLKKIHHLQNHSR